ncbi:MAG: F0F1 ATP synthase subunit delta [Chloroflexi bacterium]|nr:MAG: F0F1 ATP synthase subunit delta [Chloroflexota bacterium]TME42255.1 MAG: F0F1 ATP synthase subunit delta [Chloroflexota bacterium]TME51330.1 MAG: F0F1 ATP synthase subunit delta [Chloroflexota bacterium]
MATAAARRYARAVFELAQQKGDIEQWARRLAKIRELFADPKVAAVLTNPTIPAVRRDALVATAPHLFDVEATNLARLLIESGRVGDAAAIEEEFESLADQSMGRVRATVTTAVELTAHDRERVQRELSRRLDKEVRITVVVDPRILGGLKLQYGDRVVDASVATRLQQLRRRLAAT